MNPHTVTSMSDHFRVMLNCGYFIMSTWIINAIININMNQVCITQCYLHSPLFPFSNEHKLFMRMD